eukprot:TRINITY_DN12671_c0_g1_i1.p2 TRINITY_DN12671_c0_g1~~TRINITY_DN12671_c0_g1_i1.p2  ORF type:complete len:682 (+),score=283.16 TRINITY_DN12671_c0_g1_i1:47-2092(+)
MTSHERTPLVNRAGNGGEGNEVDGKGLSWTEVVYEVPVAKAKAPVAVGQPALAQGQPCVVQSFEGNGTAKVRLDNGPAKVLPLEEVASAGRKRILQGVAGNINSGRLCCIMGPSGAGKSSLLNLLAGRVASGVGGKKVEGSVMLDGAPLNPADFRTKVAYVMQEDALFATQTPYEALHFSAKLRNPSLTAAEREELVTTTLKKLRLEKCKDTYTGNMMIPGLSGGEKKRTAIGVELVANPNYLFLDEPTSGLDSYAAWMVCSMLKSLANGDYDGRKRTVVATIHQPSSEVFSLFDDVILLNAGRSVYNGPVKDVAHHFARAGWPMEASHNPADHVMFCMQIEGMQGGAPNGDSEAPEATPKLLLADYWATVEDEYAADLGRHRQGSDLAAPQHAALAQEARSGFCTQMVALGVREAQQVLRAKGALIARFGSTIFLNLFVGLVFRNQASAATGFEGDGLQAHFGAVTQVCIGGMFGLAQPTLLAFPLEKPVFLREYATGTYRALPYFASKLLVEIPMAIAQSVVLFMVTYWLVDMQGNFVYLVLATALLGLVSASVALLIGSVASNAQVAIQLSPLIFVPQILFSGIFIPNNMIPDYLRWIQYLCSLKYGINLVSIVEFGTVPEGVQNHTVAEMETAMMLDKLDIKTDWQWYYFLIMIGCFTVFRLVAFVVLARKGSRLQS